MHKYRKSLLFLLVLLFQVITAYPQSKINDEAFFSDWWKGLDNARQSLGINQNDFLLFTRFYSSKLDSLRSLYAREAASSVHLTNTATQTEDRVKLLYSQFERVRAAYPSSVNEYNRVVHPQPLCDSAGCNNIGFETGNLNGWTAYYAYNNNPGTYSYFNITNITGGVVGAVTEAANDTLTSTPGYYNGILPPLSRPDYQVSITSGLRMDALTGTIPVVSPYGGLYSVMLGDSTQLNNAVAILTKTFLVQPSNEDFTYQYAVILENPPSHTYYEQPFFQVALLDGNGDTIPICGQYSVVSSGGAASGFSTAIVPYNIVNNTGGDTAYYRNWTIVSVPLKKYVGQCVTVIFEAGDCSLGGHFGYAYVDATCAPFEISASSPALCGQQFISLSGPPGFVKYTWTGPPSGILGPNNTQSIKADSAGTYQLISVPVTGATCADTMTINIKDTMGPPPVPSFTCSNICQGQQVQFTNTSNPLAGPGVKYYWDFYNLGSYQDSSANPTWDFTRSGTYDIKLYEVNKGCGADTIIPMQVYVPPSAAINGPQQVCLGDSVILSATVISTPTPFCYYNWSNGAKTPSTTFYPTLTDTTAYLTITSGCTDTLYYKFTVYPTNPIYVCCNGSITAGDTTVIYASGENNYIWSPNYELACNTCDSTLAYPRETTTYVATGTNEHGCKFADSVVITVESCGKIFIPNAFTPNADGHNDVFAPQGRCISSYTMRIFDRWGNLLFTGADNQPWDGTNHGTRVMEDTYVYQLVINTWDLNQHTITGIVTLLK